MQTSLVSRFSHQFCWLKNSISCKQEHTELNTAHKIITNCRQNAATLLKVGVLNMNKTCLSDLAQTHRHIVVLQLFVLFVRCIVNTGVALLNL